MDKKQHKDKKIVESPFMGTIDEVSPTMEQLNQIREILGVECILIMTQKKAHSMENCGADGSLCEGHGIATSSIGFSDHFASNIMTALGYVLKDMEKGNA